MHPDQIDEFIAQLLSCDGDDLQLLSRYCQTMAADWRTEELARTFYVAMDELIRKGHGIHEIILDN